MYLTASFFFTLGKFPLQRCPSEEHSACLARNSPIVDMHFVKKFSTHLTYRPKWEWKHDNQFLCLNFKQLTSYNSDAIETHFVYIGILHIFYTGHSYINVFIFKLFICSHLIPFVFLASNAILRKTKLICSMKFHSN